MASVIVGRACLRLFPLLLAGVVSCQSRSDPEADADLVRATELNRLRALVEPDMPVARQLHADDFWLITPRGDSVSKDQYLGGIESGQFDYLIWEPVSTIDVRLYGDAAIIRYRSRLQIIVTGDTVPLQGYWHTDSYEKRDSRWQVVWSQATLIP